VSALDDLLNSLSSTIGSAQSPYSSASAANDVYQGYIFALVVRAAAAAGASIYYRDVSGDPTNSLIFRTSPGMLYSQAHNYTHAMIDFQDCALLEAHIGVRVQGKSGVLHECDVLVLPSDEANLSRAREVAPRETRSLLAVECKYYSSHLALHLARGFHGLQADLGLKYPFFVSNVRAARIERFLSYHNRKWEHDVMPSLAEERYFEGQIREAFKNHRAVRGSLAP
jgi:hypothetical protein